MRIRSFYVFSAHIHTHPETFMGKVPCVLLLSPTPPPPSHLIIGSLNQTENRLFVEIKRTRKNT